MSADVDFDDWQATQKAVAKLDVSERSLARILAPQRPTGVLSGLEGAFLAFLQSKAAKGSVPVERRIFLTLAESAEFSGLPMAFVRRLIASGKLKALKTGSGWRVSRAEMEKVALKLTDPPEELTAHELRDMETNRRRRKGLPANPDSIPNLD